MKRLPIGIENFPDMIKKDYYYVDKTGLIETLVNRGGVANLFTRPRRFGKSLNMSMLQSFFEIGTDKTLFDGLYISKNKALCERYMGQYPVISVSLKSVEALNFDDAFDMVCDMVFEVALENQFLLESSQLTDVEKMTFKGLLENKTSRRIAVNGLKTVTTLLEKHFNKKVIILIDEYDVPLAKANQNGYYEQMVDLIRNMLSSVLKTNDSLEFAVLTGCLRVAKESIFTGLNNFNVFSITDEEFDESFGFTADEVRQLLHYYGQDDKYDIVKAWYDGYRFGSEDVYCPWDVINYCNSHITNPDLEPKNYWLNTSGNDVIKHFIDIADGQNKAAKSELERLVNGEIIQKEIYEELTYSEMYDSIENLWSALFMTGYLTYRGKPNGRRYDLIVPNLEIRNIITEHILTLFRARLSADGQRVNDFCSALLGADAKMVEKLFTEFMESTISVRDTFVRKNIRENFYHGILLGILGCKAGWSVRSNCESGDGFSDIQVLIDDSDTGIVIEVKYADDGNVDELAEEAIKQIDKMRYTSYLYQYDVKHVLKYGIACYKKKCTVAMHEEWK